MSLKVRKQRRQVRKASIMKSQPSSDLDELVDDINRLKMSRKRRELANGNYKETEPKRRRLRRQHGRRERVLIGDQTGEFKASQYARRKRNKKSVCFGCRQRGHMLSECPKIEGKGCGCLKCGSGEHRTKDCHSSSESFNFAMCFLCNKIGHIARSCPEKPNNGSIYPDGGCCHSCGSVAHLKRNCLLTTSNKLTSIHESPFGDEDVDMDGETNSQEHNVDDDKPTPIKVIKWTNNRRRGH
ncbi:hypothetical protein ACOME3_003501 [Neoechinorhynchus agilis]